MCAAHLNDWQHRAFDISSDSSTPEQKADAYRGHVLALQYAWASGTLSESAAGHLLRGHTEHYAAILDSDDPRVGLNNYAESALHLARGLPNHSEHWQSALTPENVMELPFVRNMLKGSTELGPEDFNVVVGDGKGTGDIGEPAWRTGMGVAEREVEVSPHSLSSVHTVSFGRPPLASTPAVQPLGHQPAFFPCKRKTFCSSSKESKPAALPSANGNAEGGRSGGSFRSAREQLAVEQQRKQQQQQQRSHPPGLAAATKKSLGANRQRGAFSKFVSPLPRQDDSDWVGGGSCSGGAPQESQVTDERLKNFEPKIIELITSEIMDHGPPVSWDDIAGLEFAKTTIKEIVVWPMLRPDIFTGLRGPPKGILLFGPPGTGKTLIGKCIACQSGATFFSISASSLTSKWVGEGEKMVRALFAVARCHQPAVIFIDEIDSLLSQRTDGEHDSSRRIKTEFLVQLDGATTSADDRVLVVGATNRPQEIDEAARRRLAKRLYVPLPEAAARRQIVTRLMLQEKCELAEDEVERVVSGSEGFSGADVTQLCREAALGPIRSISAVDITTISPEQVRPILYTDFQEALHTVRPSVSSKDLEVYEEWNRTFGCGR